MYHEKSVAVVVPAKNERDQIPLVLGTMSRFVDRVIVVDDGSTDGTGEVVQAIAQHDARITLIRHERTRGVGAAISTGYQEAKKLKIDITAVMAGDGQMNPDDLEVVVYPVSEGIADYCKGNRFTFASGLAAIPSVRKFGNFALSILTKIVSGYWHVSDTQCGFTAISLAALENMEIENIYAGYGCPNDILVKLNIGDMRVVEVPVSPMYNVGEASKMRIPLVVLPILRMLFVKFIERMVYKYVLRNGHPMVFAYLFACLFLLGSLVTGIYIGAMLVKTGLIMKAALFISGFFLMVGIQLLLTALWMDSAANQHLCVHLSPAQVGESTARHIGRASPV
jgi:glycosyltransferase involved in cell wall biosynthesis